MDITAAGFDWADFEDELVDGLVGTVQAVMADDPGESFCAAALGYFGPSATVAP